MQGLPPGFLVHGGLAAPDILARPEPTGPPVVDIRDNIVDRIAEAELGGWLGEVEGLRVSQAGAKAKLTQIDHRQGKWQHR